jgi:menaquinone-9 beta-reductase
MVLGFSLHDHRQKMIYDVAIIGGGISGLSLAIDLTRRGHSVVVVEKGSYPRTKVCGEYISNESRNYLFNVCPSLNGLELPLINKFRLSSTNGSTFEIPLSPGGFGISRYALEMEMYTYALSRGVSFHLNTKLHSVKKDTTELFDLNTSHASMAAKLVCNSTGRSANSGTIPSATRAKYVAVKYHVKIKRDSSLIEIHNFPGGYCGISDVEENKSCLCYIINSELVKRAGNNISATQQEFLFENPRLKQIFVNGEFCFGPPVTVSGIHFGVKKAVQDEIFFLGDAAGTIAPITGNGMSMGIRSAAILSGYASDFLHGKISFRESQVSYDRWWNKEFAGRIKASRYFQKLSEFTPLTKPAITLFRAFPFIASALVKQTHGKPF